MVCRDSTNTLSTCSSSRKFKVNITNLTDEQNAGILRQIAGTNIATFNYRIDRPDLTRVGIIAEEAPLSIRIVDENNNTNIDFMSAQLGYSWAGIKALNSKAEKLESENIKLKQENTALKARLDRIEACIAAMEKATNGNK